MATCNLYQFVEILKKYTDEDHPLSVKELIGRFESEYHIKPCRQTISSYMKELEEMNISVECEKRRYYLSERTFEDSEITLLCLSIMASNVIPANQANDLIKRLKGLQTSYYRDNDIPQIQYAKTDRRDNQELFINIEKAHQAIEEGKTITFHYYRYAYDGRSKLQTNSKYVQDNSLYRVMPLFIGNYNNRYYLIGLNIDDHDKILHYRLDKIKAMKEGEAYAKQIPEIDITDYMKHHMYMMGGEIQEFTLEVEDDSTFFDEFYDICGNDAKLKKSRPGYYEVKVKTTESAIRYLALQYLNNVRVLKPQYVADDIGNLLQNKADLYHGTPTLCDAPTSPTSLNAEVKKPYKKAVSTKKKKTKSSKQKRSS